MRDPRAETHTASASCSSGRGHHTSADYFRGRVVFHNYEQDRKAASQRVLETVRSIRLVLDAARIRATRWQAPQDEVLDPRGEERGNAARLEPWARWMRDYDSTQLENALVSS